MSETDLIDLNKRTQKELLLEVYKDVKGLKTGLNKIQEQHATHDIAIATIKTQLRSWAIVWGSVSAIIVSIISKLLSL